MIPAPASSIPEFKRTPETVFQPRTAHGFQGGINKIVDAIRPPEPLDSGGIIARRIISLPNRDEKAGAMYIRGVTLPSGFDLHGGRREMPDWNATMDHGNLALLIPLAKTGYNASGSATQPGTGCNIHPPAGQARPGGWWYLMRFYAVIRLLSM